VGGIGVGVWVGVGEGEDVTTMGVTVGGVAGIEHAARRQTQTSKKNMEQRREVFEVIWPIIPALTRYRNIVSAETWFLC
jgi:uncharacterized protein YcfJ